MDNSCKKQQLKKIIKYTIHQIIQPHGEYDFGSYKRSYLYAKDNNLLNKYDYIYMLNDSVYGPLSTINFEKALIKLENSGADFIGMVSNQDVWCPKHIQSWFIGIKKEIVKNKQFDNFMQSIKKESSKLDIVNKYKIGLSNIIRNITDKTFVLFEQNNNICNTVWSKPWILIKQGIPFIKKSAIQHCFSYSFLEKILQNNILLSEIKSKKDFYKTKTYKTYNNKTF